MKAGLLVVLLLSLALAGLMFTSSNGIQENQRMITSLAVKCEIAGGYLLRFNDALLGNAVGCFTGVTQISINEGE